MRFLDFFRHARGDATAPVAKERLQVIVAHQRRHKDAPEYLARLQKDILAVIRRYAKVADDAVDVQVERSNGCEVLELNVTLPDEGIHLPAQRQRQRRGK
ncbi:MAG: cell division topological specificity factor MinE [Gammaproteobacteria bacterium]|nr:cell division topological specificity factor MinE [Gammaproteobacteria bacterium]